MPDLKTSEPTRVTEVQQDGTWFAITTTTPDGSTRKYKTNREEGGREAGRLKVEGALVTIQYAERNDKPNPRGGFFHDFYWYSAQRAAASTNGAANDGITRVTTSAPEKTPGEAWRIALSVGSERAVQLAPLLPTARQDFPFIWALAYEFASRIYLTPPPSPDALEALPSGGLGDDDEDIPF